MKTHFPEYARQARTKQPEKLSQVIESPVQPLANLTSIHHHYLSFLPKIVNESEVNAFRRLWLDSRHDILEQSPQLREKIHFFAEFETDFVSTATEILDSFSVEELQICVWASENERFKNFGEIARRKKLDFMRQYEAELQHILEFLRSEPEKSKGDTLIQIEKHLVISVIHAFLANFTDDLTSLHHKQSASERFEIVMQFRREQTFYSEGVFHDLQFELTFQRLYRLPLLGNESPEVFQAFAGFNEGNLKIWVDAYEQEYRKSITDTV